MSVFKQKASTQKEFDLAPAGQHAGCFIAVIDLGTHRDSFPGSEPKDNHKIFIGVEIDHEPEGGTGRIVIGREYNLSFTSKSSLRLMIEKLRSKPFAEGEDYDVSKLAGKPCLVNIMHSTTGDKTFAKLEGLGPMPKGMAAIKPSRTPILFDADSGENFPTAEWLPWSFGKKLIDKFNARLEIMGQGNGSKPVAAGATATTATDASEEF